ncbi:MAG TPA: IPT/TIG domain-containing protein, partial [Anaeromyxobacteraceae bacterium]|nr:IPT/TIG domain-containing protein [Anaeromyxobacteraceae bacterium]
NAFSIFSQRIHFDPGTGFVYGDDARAIDPDSGLLVGTFIPNTYSWASSAMIPDSTLGTAFFVRPDPSGSSSFLVLRSFDIVHYVAAQSTTLAYVSGTPVHLIRWWTDGLAFLAGNQIVLLRGSLVLPPSSTANPAPSVAALSPATAAAGGGNFRLTVTGSGFVPGSIVRWNGSDRTTRYASATSLVAFIPASDVVAAGSAQVTVRNPLPGGGVSDASTFDVTP